MGDAGWGPLLTGLPAQSARDRTVAIAESIATYPASERDPSLAGGVAGFALLYTWLAQAGWTTSAREHAWRFLDEAIEGLSTLDTGASLFGGFTGTALATTLVDAVLDPTCDDRVGTVDDSLQRLLSRARLWPAPQDLVIGVTGLGVYALERYPRPAAIVALRHVVARLADSAVVDGSGHFWPTPPSALLEPQRYPQGVVDLGVAHGMAGAIALLGRVCGLGGEFAAARPLLDSAVRWLTAHAIEGDGGPTYPVWLVPGEKPSVSRSAWCYGDPGIAAALLVAARAVGEASWEREATALAVRAAARPDEETGVVDACFCHGTAGLAHIFNRLYQATGEPAVHRAALHWLERTLDICRAAEAQGGSWVEGAGDVASGPWTGLDIVGGAAGVALVLLAASTEVEPRWDRMFLISPTGVALGESA